MRIVVVEDELKPREGLVRLIRRLDPSSSVVGQARNGKEGKAIIEQLSPELVITDIKMPEMSGLDMIRALRSEGCTATFVILSGYAEFEFAKQGILLGVRDYLLKPVSPKDIKELLEKIARSGPGSPVILVPAAPRAGGALLLFHFARAPHSAPKLLSPLLRRCVERTPAAGAALLARPDDSSFFYHVACSLSLAELIHLLENELGMMREHMRDRGMTCSACAFPPGGDAYGLLPLLRAMLKWSMRLEPPSVIDAARIAHMPCTQPEYPGTIEAGALAALRAGDPKLIESACREFQSFCLMPAYAPPRLEEIAFRFFFTAANLIKEIDYECFRSIVKKNILQRIEGFRSAQELCGIIDDFISCATEGVSSLPHETYSLAVRQTLNYIRTGYRGKVSLEQAAGKIGMTPEYLSSLFLRETGMHFSACLVECRLREAKQLLAAGQDRIFAIAEAVGVSDPRYFCRVFKKHTGLTPREYAHLHQ